MLVNSMIRLVVRRVGVVEFKKCHASTTAPSNKLTSSYYHHASSLPFVYKTLSQSFDDVANKYPDHEIFVFKSENKRYTYETLKDEIDRIAASLLELGFEKNDRFAVWLPNTSENVVMSFVTSKLGLIKVNINPAYSERELAYCINKVGCKGILFSPSVKVIDSLGIFRRLAPELDQGSGGFSSNALPTLKHVILTGKNASVSGIHSYADLLERGNNAHRDKLAERQASVDPDSPVSIFYTSGTTGQPKAATLTNFGILNLLDAQREQLQEYFTRYCVPLPLFHITAEVMGMLNVAVGKCQVIFPSILPDAESTMRAIQEEKCTGILGAPTTLRDIQMHPKRKDYDLSSLKVGAVGSSPMHSDFLRKLETDIPIEFIGQGYGLTENAGMLTNARWAGLEDIRRRHSSLGRCMQRLEVKVVDSQGQTVPIGQPGELWARGYPIMAGYYGDPEKTREAITSSGWLRTGDIVTMDDEGYLFFVGRQKEMIIRGGINIYPIEVENAISEHPSVVEAHVFGIPDERFGEEVCAWIRLKPDATKCQTDEIKQFLKDKLAFFKIPKHIRFVEKFFVNAMGKVQKFKLSEAMAKELKETTDKQ